MRKSNPMPVYVTKYATSEGILVKTVEIIDDKYASVVDGHGFFGAKDWFANWGAALADAEARRVKKIDALRKQIAKIEKMIFTDPAP